MSDTKALALIEEYRNVYSYRHDGLQYSVLLGEWLEKILAHLEQKHVCSTCDDVEHGCRGEDSLCNDANGHAEWRAPRD